MTLRLPDCALRAKWPKLPAGDPWVSPDFYLEWAAPLLFPKRIVGMPILQTLVCSYLAKGTFKMLNQSILSPLQGELMSYSIKLEVMTSMSKFLVAFILRADSSSGDDIWILAVVFLYAAQCPVWPQYGDDLPGQWLCFWTYSWKS